MHLTMPTTTVPLADPARGVHHVNNKSISDGGATSLIHMMKKHPKNFGAVEDELIHKDCACPAAAAAAAEEQDVLEQVLGYAIHDNKENSNGSSSSSSLVTQLEQQRLIQERLMAALQEEAWDIVEDLCEDFPSLARVPISMVFQGENSSCLPIHFASAQKSTPVSTINVLVTAYPASLLAKESIAGRLPLHMAVLKGSASLAVVQYLVEAEPSALEVADQEGNLPLHIAAMNGGSNAVIQLLVRAYPKACSVANKRSERLPLHLLCARCWDQCCSSQEDSSVEGGTVISVETIQQVMDTHPEALQAPDRCGRLPLHVSCSSDPRADILNVLVDRYPQALLTTDQSKFTPLDLAKMIAGKDGSSSSAGGTSACSTAAKSFSGSNEDVVLAFLVEATNREQRKKYKFLAPFKQVGSRLARRRSRGVKPNAELYSCYG